MKANRESADPRLRVSIGQTHELDIDDVRLRLEAAEGRKRKRALLSGGMLMLVLVSVLTNVYVLRDGRTSSLAPPATDRESNSGRLVAAADVPLGAWLISGDTSGALVSSAGTALDLKDVRAYDISPDGRLVAATSVEQITYGEQDDPSSLSLTVQQRLLVLDSTDGSPRVVTDAGPRGTIVGPVLWSPDGSEIAYRMVTWTVDPYKEHPLDRVESEIACVARLDVSEPRCLGSTEGVLSFDWSPTGTELIVQRQGEGIAAVDARSDTLTTIIGSEGTPSIRSLFEAEGWGELLTLSDPRWSPSGEYFAALAQTSAAGSLPLVLDPSGRVVAWGLTNQDYQIMAWSPSDDVLAYTTGVQIESDPAKDDWSVKLLTPPARENASLLTLGGPAALITGLTWSPDGAILAVDGSEDETHDVVTLVDVDSGQIIDKASIASRVPDSLVDWGPSS